MTAVLTSGVSFALQKANFEEAAAISNIQNNIPVKTSGAGKPAVLLPLPLPPPPPPQKLSNPPEIIKAVYVTGWSAGARKYLNYLSNLFEATEINAVVVEIKGSNGLVSYASGTEEVKKYRLNNNAISDINALVRFFHDKNIYVIGRIAVFEDPVYSKARPELAVYNKTKTEDLSQPVLWRDNNGLSWLDPASKEAWDYNISLAKDAFYHGFDEINFDYIRFPTDGNIKNMRFPVWDEKTPMATVIKEFFQYVRSSLSGEKISADLFGLTTVNTDDMGIGQIIENAFETFDYISPMVYPSHYAKNFIGFYNPAEHPYEVIKYSMDSALARKNIYIKQQEALALKNSEAFGSPAAESQQILNPIPVMEPLAKFRPWLQDFDMGADYTADMVKKEIKATENSLGNEYAGYMLWNPSNIYTQGAVLKIK
ncbi:MAG: putative glycoside hydrolase [bacterium]